MALTKEQLIAKGISEEIVNQVLAPVNELFKDVLNNNYVSKESFNNVNTRKNEIQAELDATKIENARLKPFEQDCIELTTKVTNLETANAELQAKYDNQATVLMNENLVKNELLSIVVDMEDVFPKIDMSKIVFKDGKIESGLSEQIDEIKKSKPHYFKSEDNGNKGGFFGFKPNDSNTGGTNGDSDDVALAKSLASIRVQQNKTISEASNNYFKGGFN